MSFEKNKKGGLDFLYSQIEKKKQELSHSIDELEEDNPIVILSSEDNTQAIFSSSKISDKESSEGRKQSFSKLFSSKLSSRNSMREEDKTASVIDSEEP